jgi:hypothetical protein
MNAVDRLWRALRREHWESAAAQMHDHAVIRWPHTGERFDRASDYITAHRLDLGRTSVDVRRTIADRERVALLAVLTYPDQTWYCAAVYELHEARIASGIEVWTREGRDEIPPERA